jgi:hypothetical protein
VREGAADEPRITPQMLLEQIDAPAVQRHHRRVGHFDALPGRQFETSMLTFREAAIGLKKQSDRRQPVSLRVGKFGAKPEQQLQAGMVQGFAWSHHAAWTNLGSHGQQTFCRFDLSLQTSTIEGVLHIGGPQFPQHPDDPILPNVRRVRHWRSPVAVGQSRAFSSSSLGSL